MYTPYELVKAIDRLSKADFLRFKDSLKYTLGLAIIPYTHDGPTADYGTNNQLYSVILIGIADSDRKIQSIKGLRSVVDGIGLKEAKDMVDAVVQIAGCEQVIKDGLTEGQAEAMAYTLHENFCVVSIRKDRKTFTQ